MNVQQEHSAQEWGPFGRPLFDDAETRALERVGVVDVGSNSVRLVVFDGAARSPAYFFNEKILCGLGAGLGDTGRLNPKGRARALSALARFKLLAEGMDLPGLTVIATAAVRDAEDGPEFCAEVEKTTGLRIHVIDGDEEARLSAQGVLLWWPGSYGLICDIGGSSMEMAEISDGTVGRRLTSDLGPLKMQTLKGGQKARKAYIKTVLADMQEQLGQQRDRLFLVGGSWRAIAKIDMVRRGYPLHVLHEYRMKPSSVIKTVKFIKECDDWGTLRAQCGISSTRMGLVPLAAEVLGRLVRTFKPQDIAVSSYGIREGLLYEQMPERLRARDPLIESCRFAEAKDARLPGFGRQLYDFILPLFRNVSEDRKRLIKAACLLHDVSWRAHPDYRAEVCFDNATRANMGGLKHSERVYLGLALFHRYSSKRDGTRFQPLEPLLTPKDLLEAEVLGKAMRFGAMFWMRASGHPAEFRWYPKKQRLELRLIRDAMPLYGEVAAARLESLASSLDAELVVKKQRKDAAIT
ncbi:MAG: Ppx/GppA family phosphatase [Paracoccaceae bacterium]